MDTQYTTTFGSGIVQRKENITVYITCEWNCPYKVFSTLHLGFKPCYPNSRGFFLNFFSNRIEPRSGNKKLRCSLLPLRG